MTPEDYIKQALIDGKLTYRHIAKLTEYFQKGNKLVVDGKPGPTTLAILDPKQPSTLPVEAFLYHPLPKIGARVAKVTSSFRPKDRPNHDGLDFFYVWEKGDKPDFVGDKGATSRKPNGEPKWVVPYDVCARAAADGVVQIAGNSPTGYRVWIDHGNGLRSGYFHLLDMRVAVGQPVGAGRELGLVGDNPKDNDGRHLHLELSPVDRYAPIDPTPFFIKGQLV